MKLAGSRWFACPNAVFENDLAVYEALLLIYLYRRAGPDGSSWPSYTTIAKDCRMGRRQAIITIRGLESKKLIVVEKGDKGTNIYRVVNDVHQGGESGSPDASASRAPEVHSVRSTTKAKGVVDTPTILAARRRKSDTPLETARMFVSPDAREVVRVAAEKFGWPQTPWRLGKEARLVQQLLDVGIGRDIILENVRRRDRLGSIQWLHTGIDVRAIAAIEDDRKRQEAMQEVINKIWGNKDGTSV